MIKVIASVDCGNSPKNLFVQKISIAIATGDVQFALNSVTEDIGWTLVGRKSVHGKNEFAKLLKRSNGQEPTGLTIYHAITHGKAGAVNGLIGRKDGKRFAFCDVYEFTGAKGIQIKEITSYLIEVA